MTQALRGTMDQSERREELGRQALLENKDLEEKAEMTAYLEVPVLLAHPVLTENLEKSANPVQVAIQDTQDLKVNQVSSRTLYIPVFLNIPVFL